ncbi:hypothetical protein JJJA_0020 [Achromobacter phage JWDelta]|uniref:BIG2 domain-containing protein n=1 Tax=Achromobacter phage JWDelta TaxID=1416008 RepID=V9SI35_9CAUD|nr:hypothetical protein JJJA_0020 [Achromobacter phage JWDelta]
MIYQIAYNAKLSIVRVQADGAAPGTDFVVLDKFNHPDPDTLGPFAISHAMYSHVQDVMYRKAAIQDMQRLSIEWPAYVAPTSLTVTPDTLAIAAGTEGKLVVTSAPADISDPRFLFIFVGSEKVMKINPGTGQWAAVGPGKGVVRVYHVSGTLYKDVSVEVEQAGVVPATAVAVAPATANVNVGAAVQLAANKTPANSTDTVYWSAQNANATVDAFGKVTGKAVGTCVISAKTDSGKIGTATITVNQPVASVSMTPVNPTVAVGATQQMTATVLPANASNKAVTYTSATPAVATVSATGLVTGVAAGTSVITVKTTDGNKTATQTVTVPA